MSSHPTSNSFKSINSSLPHRQTSAHKVSSSCSKEAPFSAVTSCTPLNRSTMTGTAFTQFEKGSLVPFLKLSSASVSALKRCFGSTALNSLGNSTPSCPCLSGCTASANLRKAFLAAAKSADWDSPKTP
eukprot:Blabericola_migrator_1__7227@NODE_366_length_9388_cov_56_375818_g293_i0_p9_GENE_NODE_366_length_9388_cov_56_375818_g293_i0NODE_366_length_9388_cov_56_375818_g293_i0_p9_ORF_typecomplete_len129_score11_13_NODE_366_length_9388_cov_56_375818_g293_i010821468